MAVTGARVLAAVALGGPALLASCSGGVTNPSELEAAYDLALVDGRPLPFPHFIATLTGDTLMIADVELQVLSRGRLRMVRWFQFRPTSAPPGPRTADTLVRAYRESGSVMYIDHPASGTHAAFTDTVQVLQNSLLATARIVTPIAYAQVPILRREMYYVLP